MVPNAVLPGITHTTCGVIVWTLLAIALLYGLGAVQATAPVPSTAEPAAEDADYDLELPEYITCALLRDAVSFLNTWVLSIANFLAEKYSEGLYEYSEDSCKELDGHWYYIDHLWWTAEQAGCMPPLGQGTGSGTSAASSSAAIASRSAPTQDALGDTEPTPEGAETISQAHDADAAARAAGAAVEAQGELLEGFIATVTLMADTAAILCVDPFQDSSYGFMPEWLPKVVEPYDAEVAQYLHTEFPLPDAGALRRRRRRGRALLDAGGRRGLRRAAVKVGLLRNLVGAGSEAAKSGDLDLHRGLDPGSDACCGDAQPVAALHHAPSSAWLARAHKLRPAAGSLSPAPAPPARRSTQHQQQHTQHRQRRLGQQQETDAKRDAARTHAGASCSEPIDFAGSYLIALDTEHTTREFWSSLSFCGSFLWSMSRVTVAAFSELFSLEPRERVGLLTARSFGCFDETAGAPLGEYVASWRQGIRLSTYGAAEGLRGTRGCPVVEMPWMQKAEEAFGAPVAAAVLPPPPPRRRLQLAPLLPPRPRAVPPPRPAAPQPGAEPRPPQSAPTAGTLPGSAPGAPGPAPSGAAPPRRPPGSPFPATGQGQGYGGGYDGCGYGGYGYGYGNGYGGPGA